MIRPLLHLTGLNLRLNFRNRMALVYGYLFPLIFLLAFWAIYRNDAVPLALHLGQLLTVTALGGACFGLPTTLVSERERGVWRRYRLAPVSIWTFILPLLAARYVLLVTAALLQMALGLALGMPVPLHPAALLLAFTVTATAFVGFGLVIAMLADTVPAVQALGQCIFLPMLMIGGVALPLSGLPDWAQHASAFFPGRYAVAALQACVTGPGLPPVHFDLAALLLIGAAGGIAGANMFRWEARQRFAAQRGKAWLLLALGMWVAVGLLAEAQGRIKPPLQDSETVPPPAAYRAATPVAKIAVVPPPQAAAAKPSWHTVTAKDIDGIAFDRLPPDEGVVSPVAAAGEDADPVITAQLDRIRDTLPAWRPGRVADPVQRARNLLAVAAVPDVLQMEQVERFVPLLVFARLRQAIPQKDLPGILYWIALHPDEGSIAAIHQLAPLGLPDVSGPGAKPRSRVMLYAFKLLGRLTGHIKS